MFGWFRKYVRKISIFGVEVEFHPPPPDQTKPGVTEAVRAETGEQRDPPPEAKAGMTFEAVIRAIRERYPEAVLGRTAESGPYFERARHLTNYQLHASYPPWYKAAQPNGKTMWLYLGKDGKICCGDKE